MRYSLRSLMIVVTLVAVILGGRIEYLRRHAVFHDAEESRILLKLSATHIARYDSTESIDATAEMLKERLGSLAMERQSVRILPGFFRPRLAAHGEVIPFDGNEFELWVSAIHERHLSDAYQTGMSRPWLHVDEPPRLQVILP